MLQCKGMVSISGMVIIWSMGKFCYLGYMLNADGGANSAVVARVRCAWKKFRELSLILTFKGASLKPCAPLLGIFRIDMKTLVNLPMMGWASRWCVGWSTTRPNESFSMRSVSSSCPCIRKLRSALIHSPGEERDMDDRNSPSLMTAKGIFEMGVPRTGHYLWHLFVTLLSRTSTVFHFSVIEAMAYFYFYLLYFYRPLVKYLIVTAEDLCFFYTEQSLAILEFCWMMISFIELFILCSIGKHWGECWWGGLWCFGDPGPVGIRGIAAGLLPGQRWAMTRATFPHGVLHGPWPVGPPFLPPSGLLHYSNW